MGIKQYLKSLLVKININWYKKIVSYEKVKELYLLIVNKSSKSCLNLGPKKEVL